MWDEGLVGFDRQAYIWNGITDGFDIGWLEAAQPTYYDDPCIPTIPEQDIAITNWIVKCHTKGFCLDHLLRVMSSQKFVFCPFIQVLKPNFKQRIVCDLSYGKHEGGSVNQCIVPYATEVRYIKPIEIAVRSLLGQRCLFG